MKHSTVFQKPTQQADYPDVFTQSPHSWNESTDTTYNQVNPYPCLRGKVEFINGLRVHQAVDFN